MGDRVIPGFYYDREKGRYFKIRDDPSGSQNCYTTESIRKQQLAIKLANLKKDIDKRNLNKNISCRLNTLLHLAQRSQQCGKITPNQIQTFGFTNMKSAVLTQFKTGNVSVGNSLRLHDGRILLKSYGPSTNQQTHLTIYDLDIENSPSCSKPKELFICKDFYLVSKNLITT
ncbi:hypothetical protein EB796_021872 [Bugula neritina]|uniref:Uncharacterized protein n=1 Tax=Bugula neritina TaxID=10212 RepID=A0A7J7J149_BUGNE|nr:hypothetical protein EB796_021872 [Bugula neritina]